MPLSMNRWLNKVAIVTGATTGIGAAIADALVKNGLNVVGVGRRTDLILERAKTLPGGKLHAFKADITKEDEVLGIFDWATKNLGPVHILVNNAGTGTSSSLTGGETDKWRSVIDLNVMALCMCTREAVKIMKENDVKGHIVHINSIMGHKVIDMPDQNVYPASKHAVTALTETLRLELNHLGLKIKVTSISPGFVATERTTSSKTPTPERKAFLEKMPRMNPEDIADAVLYVLSTPEHVQVHELTIKSVGEVF